MPSTRRRATIANEDDRDTGGRRQILAYAQTTLLKCLKQRRHFNNSMTITLPTYLLLLIHESSQAEMPALQKHGVGQRGTFQTSRHFRTSAGSLHSWLEPTTVIFQPLCFIPSKQESTDFEEVLSHRFRVGEVAEWDLYYFIALVAEFFADFPISLPGFWPTMKVPCHTVKVDAETRVDLWIPRFKEEVWNSGTKGPSQLDWVLWLVAL